MRLVTDFMVHYGARLVDGGFRILPLAPGQKYPGAYKFGTWGKMYGWGRFSDRPPSALELHHWCQWPGAGVGIVGGNVVAIDLDILDASLAHTLDCLCRTELGDTPAFRIGQAPKRLLVYRTTEPFNSSSFGPIEILCLGRQFVAYGIHPATGRPYDWPEEGLADLDLLDLPVVSRENVADFVKAALEIAHFPAQRLAKIAKAGPRSVLLPVAAFGGAQQRGTVDAVNAAMRHIGNPDLHYDEWIRIGMALKGALGEEGRSLFDAWSRRSAKYDEDATIESWNSMQPRSIGAGTIYYLARLAGWQPDPKIQLNADFDDRKRRLRNFQHHKG